MQVLRQGRGKEAVDAVHGLLTALMADTDGGQQTLAEELIPLLCERDLPERGARTPRANALTSTSTSGADRGGCVRAHRYSILSEPQQGTPRLRLLCAAVLRENGASALLPMSR